MKKFKKSLIAVKNITLTSIKMFFRDKRAIFWSLFLPIMIMSIFGVMDFDKVAKVNLGLVDEAKNEQSIQIVESIKKIDTFKITEGTKDDEKNALEKGDRDMVLILPESFGSNIGASNQVPADLKKLMVSSPEIKPLNIELFYNEGKADKAGIGTAVLSRVFDKVTHSVAKVPDIFILDRKPISSKNLKYIDFLIPGIVAMGIMQMSVMGVVGAIVNWRERGILRRLLAAPVHPFAIIFSQVVTRLIISILQASTIILLGIYLFHVKVAGNPLLLLGLVSLGAIIFLSIGFTISSLGKTQNTVMALANIVMMPMMFLSGVFFPRDALPEALGNITQYLPLTYLANGMRHVMTEGYNIFQIQGELYGLLVWVLITFLLAVKFFKWE